MSSKANSASIVSTIIVYVSLHLVHFSVRTGTLYYSSKRKGACFNKTVQVPFCGLLSKSSSLKNVVINFIIIIICFCIPRSFIYFLCCEILNTIRSVILHQDQAVTFKPSFSFSYLQNDQRQGFLCYTSKCTYIKD